MWGLLTLFPYCSTQADFPVLKGPYLGQKPPGLTPKLFAPGIVPTEDNEHLYGFFNNGTLFLFDRTPTDLEEWTPAVYRMELKDGKWTRPDASPYQGKPWYHYYTEAPEGEQVYFAWKGSLGDRTSSPDINIWRVRKTAEGWTEPSKLPFPVNSSDIDTYPSVTDDGTLYFFSDRKDGLGGHDIYRSPQINGTHTTVEHLGASINTEHDDLDPFIGPGNPAAYISSVAYGRRFYILVESTQTSTEIEAAISASYNAAAAGGAIDAEATYVRDLDEVRIKVHAMGGDQSLALGMCLFSVDNDRQSVHRLLVNQDIHFDQVRWFIVQKGIVHRGIASGGRLELVKEIYQDLGEGNVKGDQYASGIQVFHLLKDAATTRRQLHRLSNVLGRGKDAQLHPRLGD